LEASWAAHHPADAREYGVDLLGTNAGLSLYPPRLFRPGPSGYETIHLAVPKGAYNEDVVHHFVGCVIGNKKTLVPLEESLKVQQVLEAIYAAAATGKEVVLKDIAMERDLS
jgi:predicted dehydrogenase